LKSSFKNINVEKQKTVDHFPQRDYEYIMWNECGIARTKTGLEKSKSLILSLEKAILVLTFRVVGG